MRVPRLLCEQADIHIYISFPNVLYIQQSARLDEPPLTDLRAMGEVAHVTKHAAIGHGLLRGLIGVIGRVRTHQGKNIGQHGARQLPGVIAARRRAGRRVELARPRTALGTGLELFQETHPELGKMKTEHERER